LKNQNFSVDFNYKLPAMRKYQAPVFAIILLFLIFIGNGNVTAQVGTNDPVIKVSVRKFSGFSEFLTIDRFVQYLNKLNQDRSIIYVKHIDGTRADYVADIKTDNSFPKKLVKQTYGTLTDIKSPGGAVYSSDEIYVPNYSGETRGIRTVGAYYNNEFSLYDIEDSEMGYGTVVLIISQPGLSRKPAFKKAIYREDTALLIEEILFDELLSSMFSYFGKQELSEKSPY
jgi:hypothetical protein